MNKKGMKTILVPVDFSDQSRNALDYAILIARRLNMGITLFHAFHPSWDEAIDDAYKLIGHYEITGTPRDNKEKLHFWTIALSSAETEIPCDSVFTMGELSDSIRELMSVRPVDLIVMGTQGAGGLKGLLVGSNTTRVMEKSSCPVIAVPSAYKTTGIGKMVFATDYREGDNLSIRFLGEMSKCFGSELYVVHVLDKSDGPGEDESLSGSFVKGLAMILENDKMEFRCLAGKNIEEALHQFILEQKVDLLAVSMTDKSFMTTLFKRGLTWKLAYHSNIPVMVFSVVKETETKRAVNAF
jgi:nucleotide-binding universal stress UspA family protein